MTISDTEVKLRESCDPCRQTFEVLQKFVDSKHFQNFKNFFDLLSKQAQTQLYNSLNPKNFKQKTERPQKFGTVIEVLQKLC